METAYILFKQLKTLFTIKQVKHFLPYDSLKKLYSTLVESHLSYGSMAWGNASESTKYKTLLLQKRAIQVINKANYNSHTEPLFKRSKILKLNDLYELKVILFVNYFIANKLPISFNNIFLFNHERPNSRNTRQSNLLYQERCCSNTISPKYVTNCLMCYQINVLLDPTSNTA